jgi:hypothetical protein
MRNGLLGHRSILTLLLMALISSGPLTAVADSINLPVQKSFEKFVNEWMIKLDRHGINNIRSFNITPSDKGFVGQYICYGPECKFSIKATGSLETPYIGILHYQEKHFLKKGETREKTLHSRAILTKKIRVTEIFRFTRGEWVY